ncbi:hypothetical protein Rsub_04419 [Raphidocelis subcapitata]|uniref:Hydroxyproline O-arabinosyltransferase-like domain-containing protein n=1 Tax=Raphidocelis subcapitata TaxID=307507 RepID=A0A2V0NZH0_9CHLO|nr:hypothetical protein Rsub_04419 [Raphidocelis subcapitata]|eukprot:GBF92072.1 hypothetical protein Rsub_04419 [Raphidocelis subcapitata]
MLPKTQTPHHHPRHSTSRGPSPSLLVFTMLLGFSSGILAGFLYQQHRRIGAGLSPQPEGALPAAWPNPGGAAAGTLAGAQPDLRIVRHDFSGGASSGGASGGASSGAASSGGGSSGGSGAASSSGGGGGASSSGAAAGGGGGGGGGVVRTSHYSNSNRTGLARADAARIGEALKAAARRHKGDTIHTLFTSNGSPYQNIQGRIMYASYKLAQAMPGGEKLTGFTRILHRTTDDAVVGEIPTFRAYPLQPACDTWCEFPVKDRANAVVQWLMAAEGEPSMVKGAWLLMLESDYVWRAPVQAPGDAFDPSVQGLGFVYDYINPAYPTVAPSIVEMCPTCDPEKVPRSGPAPVLIRPHEMAVAAPDWEVYSAWIEGNKRARTNLDWVREMYAWCVAVAVNNVSIAHEAPPASTLLVQPPHDLSAGRAAIYHYTWGSIFKEGEREAWRFDKRDYTAEGDALKVPHFPLPPPWREGAFKLQDGLDVGRSLHETLTDMLTVINRAVDTLPDLTPPA